MALSNYYKRLQLKQPVRINDESIMEPKDNKLIILPSPISH